MTARRVVGLATLFSLLLGTLVGCAQPEPEIVPQTVVVEKTVGVPQTVVVEETVEVEVEVEKVVEVTPTPEPVEISVWTEFTAPPKTTAMDEWIAGFEAEYPWVTVKHRGISNENWEDALHTGLLGGKPPDVFVTESRAELIEYVDAGVVYNITNWYNDHSDRFIPGTAEINSVIRGRRFAVPWGVLVLDLLWYNADKLDEYGIDPSSIETWDDLLGVCETLKENDEVPIQLGGGGAGWTGGHWVMLLLQHNLTNEEIMQLATREKKWTDPDVVEALSHFEELVDMGYFPAGAAANDRDTARALYFQGEGAFFHAGSWHLYQKNGELAPPDWQFEFIPFPDFAGAPVEDIAIVGGNVQWTIADESENIEEALAFLEYITRLESAETWVKHTQEFIAVKDAVNDSTAEEEMVAIADHLEASNVVDMLELIIPGPVRDDGHWAGSTGVLSGQIDTQGWAELIDDIHEREGVLSLE